MTMCREARYLLKTSTLSEWEAICKKEDVTTDEMLQCVKGKAGLAR